MRSRESGVTSSGAGMIDVKLTETDLPWFFRAANVSYINTHARVSAFQKNTSSGALPIGVPDVNPKKVRVTFVNEALTEYRWEDRRAIGISEYLVQQPAGGNGAGRG